MIRLFAAIALPEDVAEGLSIRQYGLEGVRWRPMETLHITLRFFGEVQERMADDLDLELEGVGGGPFAISLAGVGSFGEGDRVNALWAGVVENTQLTQLAARCEAAARRAGLKPEGRTFKPHVTLAYTKHLNPRDAAVWVQSHNLLKSPPFPIDRFGLYSSHKTSEGSRYRLEREYRL
ncbi:MAG TPA: RNA 2',3'-cyclic phosphodiesterase [Caulobacteraceae bacterium]|nr:RNA 2',3'-cyclic phosphodiesterase [Caulobacteraceae bacterium]